MLKKTAAALTALLFTFALTSPAWAAKTAVTDWSTTAANNTDVDSINIDEGMNPSAVNNAIREIMEQIATFITAATFTGTSPLTLVSTDADAAVMPFLKIYRNSATPAVSDILGSLVFQGEDSAGNTQDYAEIYTVIADVTSPTEDGTIHFRPLLNGVLTSIMTLNGSALTLVRLLDLSSSTGGFRLPQATGPTPTAEGDVRWDTDDDIFVVGDASAAKTIAPVTLRTVQASTSGSAVAFTSIPSWARQITVTLVGVSTNNTGNPTIQIGDSGGLETTGYLGASALIVGGGGTSVNNYTAGYGIFSGSAANVIHGSITLTMVDAATFTWAASGTLALSNSAAVISTGGSKSLSAALDRLSVITPDTFDAGSINITYH